MFSIVWRNQNGYHLAADDEFRNWEAALMYARANLPDNKWTDEKEMDYAVPYWVILPTPKAYDFTHGKTT